MLMMGTQNSDPPEEDLFDDIDGVLTVGGFYERAQGKGTHLLFI